MCGRFAASSSSDRLAERFAVDDVAPEASGVGPSWNVAPTASVLAVLGRHGARSLEVVRWGLVPSWAKSPAVGARMINARAETIATSGAYRGALASRRGIIPMDGFYEWRRQPGGGRQPFYFSAKGGEVLAVAALWELWRDPAGVWLVSTTIVTTAARSPVAGIHDRMPAVLGPTQVAPWLDSTSVGPGEAVAIATSESGSEPLEGWPVDRAINRVANDGPELVRVLLT
ncbi:MAG: SOS response-associated peptidase [Acidimicrobiales bacterium]